MIHRKILAGSIVTNASDVCNILNEVDTSKVLTVMSKEDISQRCESLDLFHLWGKSRPVTCTMTTHHVSLCERKGAVITRLFTSSQESNIRQILPPAPNHLTEKRIESVLGQQNRKAVFLWTDETSILNNIWNCSIFPTNAPVGYQ